MDGEPWQKRLEALGINQRELAEAIGYTAPKLSAALRGKKMAYGVPKHLRALVLALEALDEDERSDWLLKAKAEPSQKPKAGQ